tara:strand:- start:465 stop:608 length:144 start_codon:yes stop_codon:yes gene_type:complete
VRRFRPADSASILAAASELIVDEQVNAAVVVTLQGCVKRTRLASFLD